MLCKSAASWDATLRQLYEIHVRLFVLTQLEISYKKSQHSYLHYLYQNHINEMAFHYFQEISDLISNIKIEKNKDTYTNVFEATAQFLEREFCHESIAVVDTYALYNMFWGNLLGVEPFKQREKSRLDEVLQKPPSRDHDFFIHARAFHDWLDGQDETATERLQNVEALNVFNLVGHLAIMHENKAWKRMLHWLRWLLPYIQSHGEEVEEYLHFWRVLSKHQPLEDEFLQTMAALLPYSAEYYADYLLEKEHYKRWVDLQITTDELPIYLNTYDLKKIESVNPAYLLPLYHQAIEQCILKKSRDAYESAVTMLKKLKQLYKRLDQLDKWESYIAYTVKKYSRLRLFQEELKRGRVIS